MGEKLRVRNCNCGHDGRKLEEVSREACLDLLVLAMEVRSWREGQPLNNDGEWFPSDLRGKAVLPENAFAEGSRNVFL